MTSKFNNGGGLLSSVLLFKLVASIVDASFMLIQEIRAGNVFICHDLRRTKRVKGSSMPLCKVAQTTL